MTSVVNSLAILGLGSLLPVQSSLLASSAVMARYQPETTRKASAPVAIAINATIEDCATISGAASSPPRMVSFTGTRRVLAPAPAFCLSKTKRRRRSDNSPGDGSDPDDDCGDGGGGDDGRNFGGGGGDDPEGWEDGRGGHLVDTLCLWQALCLFSLLQALHYVATGSRPRGQPHGALASFTYSLYNTRAAPDCVMDGV